MTRVEILGLPVDDVTLPRAIEILIQAMRPGSPARQVAFLNADCVNLAAHDPGYRQTLRNADWVFGDGAGVRFAAWANGTRLQDNVNGTDLYPLLMRVMALAGKRVFFLGARPEVVAEVAARAEQNWPGLRVAGYHHGYFSAEEEDQVLEEIRQAKADLLLVALGAPRQDQWIRRNLNRLEVRVAMGVGGLFDFFSGRIPRAPAWVRSLHMEWGFRLFQEPARLWRRYLLGNPIFLARVLRAKLGTLTAAPEEVRS